MERTKKSLKNIIFGLGFQVISVLSSFICRTFMVRCLGNGAVSLNGLFWEIVSMLALAELGIGSAIVYHLYKPISEGDTETIKSLMAFYKKCYRLIAGFYILAGSIVTIFVPVFVNGLDYSNSYIRVIFFLYVMQAASSYICVSDTMLLQADQKRFKLLIPQTIAKVLQAIIIPLILVITKNFPLYIIILTIQTLLTNIAMTIQSHKVYPYLKENCKKISKEEKSKIFKNVKDIFVKKIAGYATNSTDNILVSLICGTWNVGLLSNYSMLFSAVKQFDNQIAGGISASMGDLAATGTDEEMHNTLIKTAGVFQLFGMILSAGLMACASTFVTIWIGEKYVLAMPIVCICCINSYLVIVKDPLWQAMDACGLFSFDKKLAIASTTINLVTSIALGIPLGMIGIFIGTAISTIFEICGKSYAIYKMMQEDDSSIEKTHMYHYMFKWIKMFICEGILLFAAMLLSTVSLENLFIQFLVQGFSAVFAACILYIIFFKKDVKTVINLVKKIK